MKCQKCGVPVQERPLQRINKQGEKGIFWCEPCMVEAGMTYERNEIVDLIDSKNQTRH